MGVPLGYSVIGALWCTAAVIFIAHFLRKPTSRVVVRLAGFSWTRGDFCRGWLITGDTGSGKTPSGITPLLFQVFQNEPTWGGLCIDDKGQYWETLSQMAKHFGREDDLILLQVRPDGAGSSWQPRHTYNLTSDRSIPTTPSRRQASIQLPVSARPVTKSMSDYNCIDVIREARATVVAAAQSSTSFIPPLGREKARVFTLNLPIASSSKRPTKKVPSKEPTSSARSASSRSRGAIRAEGWRGTTSSRKSTNNATELRGLAKHNCIVVHCEQGHCRKLLPPLESDGKVAPWFARNPVLTLI